MSEVGRSRIGQTTHLIPDGSLTDPKRIAQLAEAIAACLADKELKLVLDLSDCPLVSGQALETLLDAQERLARIGGALRLVHANKVVRDALYLTGLEDQLTMIDAEALLPRARSNAGWRRIGEILLERGYAEPEEIEKAVALQAETGRRMTEVMLEEGWLEERELLQALGEQLSVPFVQLRTGLYDPAAVSLLEQGVARRLKVLALFKIPGRALPGYGGPPVDPGGGYGRGPDRLPGPARAGVHGRDRGSSAGRPTTRAATWPSSWAISRAIWSWSRTGSTTRRSSTRWRPETRSST